MEAIFFRKYRTRTEQRRRTTEEYAEKGERNNGEKTTATRVRRGGEERGRTCSSCILSRRGMSQASNLT
eukprot:696850-Rhodomonas_salina.1